MALRALLCSFRRSLRVLPVSPTYELLQSVYIILYTIPVYSSLGILSFGWTNLLLGLLKATLMSLSWNARFRREDIVLTKGRTTLLFTSSFSLGVGGGGLSSYSVLRSLSHPCWVSTRHKRLVNMLEFTLYFVVNCSKTRHRTLCSTMDYQLYSSWLEI